jgi:hypothetical protein
MKTMNRTIEFWTPGKIDPVSWSVMGVNAKPDSDNPIGYFGTGLKMAISTLIRTGHEVHVVAEGEEYNFTTQKGEFRGKEFNFCYCNGDKLPFTTELGKNWVGWMAYRELVSNTMDEKGEFGPEEGRLEGSTITVTGPEIHECWENHADYFCTTKPLETVESWDGNVEFHKGSGIIFYKGVRVGQAKDSAYNYNILSDMELTEDRTIKDRSSAICKISRCAAKLTTPSIIRKLFTNKDGFEQYLSFDYYPLGDAVMTEITEIWNKDPHALLQCVVGRFKKQRPESGFEEVEMNVMQKGMLARALDFLEQAGYPVTAEIKLIENENQNIVAFVYKDIIHLTSRAFDKGLYDLVQTMMEEHFHTLGYSDESRGFEKFLMDQLITQTNKHIQYPL